MRMTRSQFLKLIAAATIAAAVPTLGFARDAKRQIFVTWGGLAPFGMTRPDGRSTGSRAILSRSWLSGKFDYEIRHMAWDGMMQRRIDGKFDANIYWFPSRINA